MSFEEFWNTWATEPGKQIGTFISNLLVGGVVAYIFQTMAWRRATRLSLYQQAHRDGVELLSRLSTTIDTRFFALQRFAWAIEKGDANGVAAREANYFEAVVLWNQSLRSLHNGLRLLVGEPQALAFLDYADDGRPDMPRSLHYEFVRVHKAVMAARRANALDPVTSRLVEQLNWSVSNYIASITTDFYRRAQSLNLLEVPTSTSPEARLLPRKVTTAR